MSNNACKAPSNVTTSKWRESLDVMPIGGSKVVERVTRRARMCASLSRADARSPEMSSRTTGSAQYSPASTVVLRAGESSSIAEVIGAASAAGLPTIAVVSSKSTFPAPLLDNTRTLA